MTMLQAVVLGVVQGVTEFLPISSSGHLVLVPYLFGWREQELAFDVMIHLATFLAVVVVFRRDLWTIGAAMAGRGKRLYRRLGWLLLAGTVPVVVVGLLFSNVIETTLRQPYVVAMSLIVWGVVLGSADLLQRTRKTSVSRVRRVGVREALSIGCAQALALIPGTSRSGVTMSAGLLAGLNRETAARFSFLLSVPAVGAASLYVVTGAVRDGVTLLTPELVVGFFAALVSGVAAIRWLLRVISRYSFIPFAVYRIILGIIILALL